jgi:hypothetical protein
MMAELERLQEQLKELMEEYPVGTEQYTTLFTIGMCLQNTFQQNENLKKQIGVYKQIIAVMGGSQEV